VTDALGVHVEHCCLIHGCKYSADDCPVVDGTVTQEYPCELCGDESDAADRLVIDAIRDRNQWRDASIQAGKKLEAAERKNNQFEDHLETAREEILEAAAVEADQKPNDVVVSWAAVAAWLRGRGAHSE
jgi:hypothetical protein